ncbi:MAG: ArsR family transcriptional regulator [Bacteroidales bacterium]|nr:ArsR family transcriptional regulator [Bacteroidales bacterium]
MEVEKGKTAKYLKEKRPVSEQAKEELKKFNKKKRALLTALKDGEKTVPQLAKVLELETNEVMYQLMSLLKYGFVETGEIDDMDEYFTYKIKSNG